MVLCDRGLKTCDKTNPLNCCAPGHQYLDTPGPIMEYIIGIERSEVNTYPNGRAGSEF